MNERIRELAKQSGLWFVSPREDLMNDFAELIVRECLMKVTGAKIRNESYDELIARINEDFGVEL